MLKIKQNHYNTGFVILLVFMIIMFINNVKADTILTGDLPDLPEQTEYENYIIYKRYEDGVIFLLLHDKEVPIITGTDSHTLMLEPPFFGKRYVFNASGNKWVFNNDFFLNSSTSVTLGGIRDIYYSNYNIKIQGSDEPFFFKKYLFTKNFTWLSATEKLEGEYVEPDVPEPPLDTSPSGPFSWISNGLDTIKNGFTNGLGGITSGIANLASDIGNVASSVANLPNLIVDGFKSALEFLFVPQTNIFANLKQQFDDKLPIIGQITEIFGSLFDFGDSEQAPAINITWYGKTMNAFDLSWYAPYRGMVKGIMSAFMWLSFVLWIPKFIPKLLGGIE